MDSLIPSFVETQASFNKEDIFEKKRTAKFAP